MTLRLFGADDALQRKHPYASRREAQTNIWLTPPQILRALGPFDLDPCAAPPPQPWPTAHRMVALPDNGLAIDWGGRVWLNPPYGDQAGAWIARLAHHGDGIALLFARTETRMFRQYVWPHADALLFLYGRPRFHRPDGRVAQGGSGGPMVLIGYGERNAEVLAASELEGALVRLRPS